MSSSREMQPAKLRDRLHPDDAGHIERMVQATGFFSSEEQAIARELADERLQRGAASGYYFLLADHGQKLLGYSCYGPIPGTRSAWDLYWIVVDPASQGLGIGRQLLVATEQAIRAQRGTGIYIETSSKPRYAPTRAFYERCGYTLIGSFDNFYAPGDAKYTYCKTLATQAEA